MNITALLFLAIVAGSLLFTSGCATVTRGTTEQLMVISEPSGAAVRLSNGFTGVTPAAFTIPRKGDVLVTITKEGYEPASITVGTSLAGTGTAGFLGNAVFGGIIGGGVDIATGATLSHNPNPVKATLVPVTLGRPEKPAADPPSGASPSGQSAAGNDIPSRALASPSTI